MSGGPIGAIAANVISAKGGRDSSMPAYGSSTPTRTTGDAQHYLPTYSSMQQSPQQNTQEMGLNALYQSMANQYAPIAQQFNSMDQFYQQPTQQTRMPMFQSPALNYRPDMSGIAANLARVQPSVSEMNRRAAEAEAARRAAEEAQGGGE